MKKFSLKTSISAIVVMFLFGGCVTCSQCPTCPLCIPGQAKIHDHINDQVTNTQEQYKQVEITEEVLVKKSENPKTINP